MQLPPGYRLTELGSLLEECWVVGLWNDTILSVEVPDARYTGLNIDSYGASLM